MDVADWLGSLGLERYEAAFRDNDVDAELLPNLTADDLKEIGITSLGHRRRLLEAIAALRIESAPADDPVRISSAPPTAPTRNLTETAGERRQLTVMFCDLVGSTALSEKLDPEDLRSLLHAYRTLCGDVIARYDGFIARYVGDGILTYFGWPTAHEEDAERAVRTALEIVHTVKRASSTEALSVRIGIATGPVVVGETAGVGDQSKLAVGSTPNLAARLQGLATAGQIVIAASTRRLVGNAFELSDLGEQDLKGIAEPVHAWRVECALAAESRFDASRGGNALTPLVGREEELDLLLRRWSQAKDGEGQVVLLSGEPGIGKSRILSVLRERLEAQGVQALRFQCSPYYVNSAFWPSIDNFERALKFTRDETTDSKLDKLEALIVTHFGRPQADVRFIASILSVPCEARYGALPVTPQKHKDETLRTLVDITEAAARRHPSVMLFEDVHWADPTTLEVLDLLIDRVRTVPLLVVLTHRPEFQSRWSGQGHVGALNLSKLTRAQSAAIVSTLAGGKALPAALLEQTLTRTDGVPLFVEELTRSILESGGLAPVGDHYEYRGSTRTVTIPATLRDSLMARLDRFMPVREIAQIGAAIGREFSYGLIAAVAPMPQAQLDASLVQLCESGLAFRRGTPPDAVYTFKHALVQDAAYDSLLRVRRARIHAAVGAALESDRGMVTSQPGLIGHHYAQADMAEFAVPYLLRAGEEAGSRSAMVEAHASLMYGLTVAGRIADETQRRLYQAKLTLGLVSVVTATHGFGSHEQARPVSEAVRLCRALDSRHEEASGLLARALFGDWTYKLHVGRLAESHDSARDLLALGRADSDPEVLAAGIGTYGTNCYFLGRLEEGRVVFTAGVEDPRIAAHEGSTVRFSIDPRALMHTQFSRLLAALGYARPAAEQARLGIEYARKLKHLPSITTNLTTACMTAWNLLDVRLLENLSCELHRLADEAGFAYFLARAKAYTGWIAAMHGRQGEGTRLLREAITALDQAGIRLYGPDMRAMLADVYTAMGKHDTATALLEEALAISEQTGEAWIRAELYRRLGEANLDKPQEAEARFQAARDVARRQSARLFELRATVSLSRLWQSQGKPRDAYELLVQVYGWFTEGFDTKDLLDAKTLLAELG